MQFAYLKQGENVRLALLLALLGLIAPTCVGRVARAQEKQTVSENKPAEFVRDTFKSAGNCIRVWRFDPKTEGKQPAVLLLHGADGGKCAEDKYCSAAKRLAGNGYVVFLVHYLDATGGDDNGNVSKLVKRVLRGEATKEEEVRVRKHFDVWVRCARDAAGYARIQPRVLSERVGIVGVSLGGFVGLACASEEKLKISAAISCSGGLPREMYERVKRLPPTLVVHGEKDDVVSVDYARDLDKLGRDKKLPIEVVIYPNVGHVFLTAKGRFDMIAFLKAEKRMTEHLQTHLKPELSVTESK